MSRATLILCAGLLLLFQSAAVGQTFPVDSLVVNGPTDERINIVYLAEGYTLGEMNKFTDDVTTLVDNLFTQSPYGAYREYFNVFAIEVPSNESGTDHPKTAPDCPPLESEVFEKDTYFDSSFDISVHRCLYVRDYQAVNDAIQSNFPEWDVLFVVVNHSWYGGCGGEYAVFSMHSLSAEVAIHEVGHSFPDLADEYDCCGWPGYEAPNATAETVRNNIKWASWFLGTTPVPTPKTSQYSTVVGLFEGAVYNPAGWYRPKLWCKMRALGYPFCEVCKEQTVLTIYNRIGKTIDSYQPTEQLINMNNSETLDFVVDRMDPIPNTILAMWYIDGLLTAAAVDTFTLDASTLALGSHVLKVLAADTTPLVRRDPSNYRVQEVHWDVEVSDATGIENASSPVPVRLYQNFPNPFNPVTTIEYYLPSKTLVELAIFDLQGREVVTLVRRAEGAGVQQVTWDGRNRMGKNVGSGVYFCLLRAGGQRCVEKIVLLR